LVTNTKKTDFHTLSPKALNNSGTMFAIRQCDVVNKIEKQAFMLRKYL